MSLRGNKKNCLKRIGCEIIALILSLSFIMPVNSYASANFSDISGHWAEDFIRRAYNLDIVTGYPNGRFLPDKAVTRAEFVSMVNQALDIDNSTVLTYADVSASQWYYNDISVAVAANYAGGYSDNTFRPNNPITREEAAVMLSKVLPSYKEKSNLSNYKDYKSIKSWAVSAMEKLTAKAYMGAYSDGKIHPADPITRAQTAKILSEILDNETIVNRETVVEENNTKLVDKIYTGDVLIDENLAEGNATIDNCVILGTLKVEGGGSKSVTLNNSRIAGMDVNKDDSPVRVVTKGTTVIPKVNISKACILQTSGKDGTGMQEITVNRDADVTLKGTFPVVTVKGSSALVSLETGKITNLTVQTGGEYSDIILTGKAEVSEAIVNAESYFHGTGSILHMTINADDVTYETKPKKMSVGVNIDRAIDEEDSKSAVSVEIDPGNRNDDVDLDAKITLTFDTSIKLTTGAIITATNIKNFVTLRTVSKGGIEVPFTGTINAAKKIVTLTPTNGLNANTKYYVVLAEESIMSAGGEKNDGESSYFITGTSSSNSLARYDPEDGDTGVSVNTSVIIRFSKDVVKYSDGGDVTAAYLQECIVFKAGGSTGSAVAFTASISSQDKITITPSASLTAGQKYYVAVVANKLKTEDGGKAITISSSTWTVASASTTTTPSAATLSTLTLSPHGGTNALTGFSASATSYNVTVPFGTTSVDVAATAASGTTIQIGSTATNTASISVSPSVVNTINVSSAASGMATTTYQLNVEVAGNTTLSAISINGTGLLPEASPFTANVSAAATSASISVTSVDPNAVITIGSNSGTNTLTTDVALASGNQSITFTVKSNRTTKTYTIYFSRLAT